MSFYKRIKSPLELAHVLNIPRTAGCLYPRSGERCHSASVLDLSALENEIIYSLPVDETRKGFFDTPR